MKNMTMKTITTEPRKQYTALHQPGFQQEEIRKTWRLWKCCSAGAADKIALSPLFTGHLDRPKEREGISEEIPEAHDRFRICDWTPNEG